MIHATKILSEFSYNLKYEDLPPEVVETTKKYIADYYAAAFAGLKVNTAFNNAVNEVILDMGGKQECDFIFSQERLPAPNAAFLSACYAHGADMDDGNRKAMGHVGAHVISAVLTLSQILPINGKDIITAINVGYEVYNRVAAAVQPGLVHRGFHSTGTAGAIACGAAAAKLMGMDEEGIYNTMALSAIQASGLIIIAESGQCCKPINPANAAKTGIISARIIAKGIKSSEFPLESKKGFFHAMSDELDERMIIDDLGETFTICESYMKPYPSCRHTHCGIECALKIREELPENADIKEVRVYIYKNAIDIAGQIEVPKINDDAKFSVHYSLAVALLRGHFGLDDLDISKADDELIRLIYSIKLIEDPSMEKRDEGIRGCRVVVILSDGSEYEKTVLIPLGDAANPLSWDDIREKLSLCSQGLISEAQQSTLIKNINSLENCDSIKTINLYN
ncbi:MAG: MmgE/PrpD family protein [Clostridia bacterium]|nr:MmgE/PrpD family protein [Clostridia bacterium]MBQ7296687.1 MmgE/PrpD family protein [Clostridia bacterium]